MNRMQAVRVRQKTAWEEAQKIWRDVKVRKYGSGGGRSIGLVRSFVGKLSGRKESDSEDFSSLKWLSTSV